MAYRDPYSTNYAAGTSDRYNSQPHYAEAAEQYSTSQQPHADRYHDNLGDEAYDPYANNAQAVYQDERHVGDQPDYSYGGNHKGGYDYPPIQREPSMKSRKSQPSVSVAPVRKEGSGFEQGEFTPTNLARKRSLSARALKEYRYDHQGNLWTKGGRGRCAGRVCCCTLMTAVFLIVSIVLALALWIRPPSIMIGDVQAVAENGSILQPGSPDGFQVNLGVNISVNNPNYFGVELKKIELEIFYPINETPIGGGTANNIVFKSSSQTNFTFPFHLTYSPSNDPGGTIFLDLSGKCGPTPSNVIIDYKITLGIRILVVTISPTVSNQFNFKCPVDITKLGSLVSSSS